MDKISYETKLKMDEFKSKIRPFNHTPDRITEKHHVLGKKISEATIAVPKDWHDSLTSYQNALTPKERKNARLFALVSLRALLGLTSHMLDYIIAIERGRK